MRHHDTLLELSNYYQPLITITTLYLFIILNNNNNNNNNQHTHTDSSNTTHMCLLQFTCFITANTRSHYPFLFMDDHFCVMVWLLWIFHMITTTRSTHTHTHTLVHYLMNLFIPSHYHYYHLYLSFSLFLLVITYSLKTINDSLSTLSHQLLLVSSTAIQNSQRRNLHTRRESHFCEYHKR